MQKTVEQMLERAKRVSRRITTEEQVERGVAALESAGLLEAAEEWAETQMFADGTTMTVEDVAFYLSTANSYSATNFTKSKGADTEDEGGWIRVQEKLEQIHEHILDQQSSNLSKDWYSVNEAAKLTSFKPFTIRQSCNTGRLKDAWKEKHYRTGEWRVHRDAVEWIQNHGLPPVK